MKTLVSHWNTSHGNDFTATESNSKKDWLIELELKTSKRRTRRNI